ncbi:MAG TPA: hypothetical protein VJN21_13580 [Candidatus Acidoferrales bacterium]|nr:hypothetical protein [Candidatus Acidoferrales bacterium]
MTGRQYYLTTLAALHRHDGRIAESHYVAASAAGQMEPTGDVQVFALISADEATHADLEHDPDFEALPHPLVRVPVSARVAAALAPLGVVPTDDTFAVAIKLARVHPLLRHRMF